MKRLPPSRQTKDGIRALLEGDVESGDMVSELVRRSVQLIVEEALEGKVEDVLGRGYYERGERGSGHRNGYRRGRLKTSEGRVDYALPQVRGVADISSVRGLRELLGGRTEALERLALEMYARGCSTRDIEAIFADEEGRSLLSRTAVSELTESLWEEYEAFASRDLSELRPLFLFVDGIAERLRPGAKREAVLCAWAISWEGKKVLLHLAPGTKESTECCKDFFQDLKRRGLADPVLVVTDGAAGLIRAVEECFPTSLRQRCLAHKMRNIRSKLPEDIAGEFREAARAAYQAPSPAMARILRDDLVERFDQEAPTAVRCFVEDFEACIAHLHCPPEHRRIVRTTNLLERLFGEERRRMRAAGHFFGGERPVLKLMYAAVIRAADAWRGIAITDFQKAQLERLMQQNQDQLRDDVKPVVETDSAAEVIYSRNRT